MKALAEKLGIKPGIRAVFLNLPPTLSGLDLEDLQQGQDGEADLVLSFVESQGELDAHFDTWKTQVAANGRLWICWPKGGRGGSDLNIKNVIRIGYAHGMVESNAISIDAGWSALKFTHPKAGKVYHNSYGVLNPAAVLRYRGSNT